MDEGGGQVVNFITEAEQSLKEVAYAIVEGVLSEGLPTTASCAYFNLTTKEKREMTVRLTLRGFEVVGHSHNSQELEDNPGDAYETIYALLQCISPSYQQNFTDAVSKKLETQLDSQ